MNTTIDFSTLTIDPPAPYTKQDPTAQLENLCYVALQVLQQFKAAGATLDIDLAPVVGELAFTGGTIHLGGFGLSFDKTGKTATLTLP